MGIFGKKQEVKLEEFCRNFYDSYFINPKIANMNAGDVLYESFKKSVTNFDSRFGKVDLKKFSREMLILRFEMFALAWMHKFGERLAVAQSLFTKNYLLEKKRDKIWDSAEDYNQAIAESSTYGKDKNKALDRMFLMKRNGTIYDLFSWYIDQKVDGKCVARALNRMFTEDSWKNHTTDNFLAFKLCDRLGLKPDDINKEALFCLAAIIFGFYNGSFESFENIKIKE